MVANEVLVRSTTPDSVPATFPQLLLVEDIDSVKGVGSGQVLRLHSRSKSAATLINDLSKRPEVVYAGPNTIHHLHATASCRLPNPSSTGIPDPRPICPDFWKLWGIYNVGQNIPLSEMEKSNYGEPIPGIAGADSEALLAWSNTTGTSFTGSKDNVVAVLDSGIDYTNTALVNNIWSALGPFQVPMGGTLFPNPISCTPSQAIPVLYGFDFISDGCDPQDQYHQGTHVAGIIGANSGLGIVGMNPIANIMALRVCDDMGNCPTTALQDAIEFAIQIKKLYAVNIRVLNYSAGTDPGAPPPQGELDAINAAGDNDMLFVASAGNDNNDNDNNPVYPASYSAANLIAVAATDNGDQPATFATGGTNYGTTSVHLGAPGQDIYSTWPVNIPCPNASLKAPFTPSPGYCWDSGTSMAAPFVSGAAALVLSRCPGLSATDLKRLIVNNVDKTGLQTFSQGRLNVSKAINACQ